MTRIARSPPLPRSSRLAAAGVAAAQDGPRPAAR